MKYYTGIGSRSTPIEVQKRFTSIAAKLNDLGYILRSGGADGADSAFEQGATENKNIYLPWRGFNGSNSNLILPNPIPENIANIASTIYINWDHAVDSVKKLHARNVYQVLGHSLTHPSDFIVCWTDRPLFDSGGTMFAVQLAKVYDIPVYNFHEYADEMRFNKEVLGQ